MPSAFELQQKKKRNVSDLGNLIDYARGLGYEEEAKEAEEQKLSLLQRLGRGLTAFETGNSFYHKRYNNRSFFETYGKDIKTGLSEAFTGQPERTEPKKTFKDVMVKEGASDRPGKMDAVDVVGLMGDIIFDPTTFLGGFVGKGVVKGVKTGAGLTKKLPVVGKKVERLEHGTKLLFKPGYEIESSLAGKTVRPSTTGEAFKKMGLEDEGAGVARAGKDVAKTFQDMWMRYLKGGRSLQDDWMKELAASVHTLKKAKGFKKKDLEEAGVKIGETIETAVTEGVAKSTGDPLLDETMDFLLKAQEAMTYQETKRGILKSQLDDYMHHALTEDGAAWVAGGGDIAQFTKPVRIGAKPGFAKQRKLIGTAKDINKTFNDTYGFNLFEENAFQAFAQRGLKSIKAVRTHDFLTRIKNQFGVVVKDGMKRVDGKHVWTDEFGVKWAETGHKALEGHMLPSAIAGEITKVNNLFTNDEATKGLLKTYDSALRFFKGAVTGWFPAFHTRNAMGGVFNNWIAGLKDPRIYKMNLKVFGSEKLKIKAAPATEVAFTAKGGKKYTYGELRNLSKDYGVVGQTGYLDVTEYLQREVAPSLGAKVKKIPQYFMGRIENQLRMPLLADGLKKGLSPEDAAKRVIKYHFDYMPEGFTAFEKNVMKRVIPFYTWTRHNIPLQIEQMVAQPGKYAGVFKTQNAWGAQPSTEEEGVLPIWLRERFTIKDEGGYWSGIGLPLEEATEKLSQPLRGFGISMSPFLKVPFEQLTGTNIFKNMKIDEDRYAKWYKNVPDPMKKWLKMKEFTSKAGKKYYTVDPRRKYWLETIGMRGWNTALRLMNTADDKRNYLSLITTIKKYNYTFEDMKKWSDHDKRKELESLLIRSGELAEFRRTYVPKGRK